MGLDQQQQVSSTLSASYPYQPYFDKLMNTFLSAREAATAAGAANRVHGHHHHNPHASSGSADLSAAAIAAVAAIHQHQHNQHHHPLSSSNTSTSNIMTSPLHLSTSLPPAISPTATGGGLNGNMVDYEAMGMVFPSVPPSQPPAVGEENLFQNFMWDENVEEISQAHVSTAV